MKEVCFLIPFCILCLVVACGQGGSHGANQPQALDFDPWYPPSDASEALKNVQRESFSELGIAFSLAEGPGKELAVEYRPSLRSARITYRMPSRALYRIVQHEYSPQNQSAPEHRTEPIATHLQIQLRGLDKSEGLSPWSMVWWEQPQLGEVEIASETLSMSELVNVAEMIINNASSNGDPTQ